MTGRILTQERLKELFDYDPETGLFTRLVDVGKTKRGDVAGWYNTDGYLLITISGGRYLSHRLAFVYMEGDFPPDGVDHINQVRDDNRWSNLRPATQSVNMQNARMRKDNRSGFMGVNWDRSRDMWLARISINGRPTNIGRFEHYEDACLARKQAEKEHGYHENHGATA